MRTIVINHVTLDGVMQGPGRPDEDTRGGFAHGGWAAGTDDPKITGAIGERMSAPGSAMLLGRRSYDDMLAAWNERGGPYGDALNAVPKYVASTDPRAELAWPNTTLLSGDVPAAVAGLRAREGGNLVVMGSGELVRSLLPHGLVDEFMLIVHPLVLGQGARLFEPGGHRVELRLTGADAVDGGYVLATYEPLSAGRTGPGS
jgi:dihydrofolate reductase